MKMMVDDDTMAGSWGQQRRSNPSQGEPPMLDDEYEMSPACSKPSSSTKVIHFQSVYVVCSHTPPSFHASPRILLGNLLARRSSHILEYPSNVNRGGTPDTVYYYYKSFIYSFSFDNGPMYQLFTTLVIFMSTRR